MYRFIQLNHLKGHCGTIWSLKWTNSGNKILSVGSDSQLYIWGNYRSLNLINFEGISNLEKYNFKQWGKLAKLDFSVFSTTLRSVELIHSFNLTLVGSYIGVCFLTFPLFRKMKKRTFIILTDLLRISRSEIKSLNFSPDGFFFAASARNKELSIWMKNKEGDFQNYTWFSSHESDVKSCWWDSFNNYLISSTYNGVLRKFKLENDTLVVENILKFSHSSLWLSQFLPNSNFINLCYSDGVIASFQFSSNNLFCPKKQSPKPKNLRLFQGNSCGGFNFQISRINFRSVFINQGSNINLLEPLNKTLLSFRKKISQFGIYPKGCSKKVIELLKVHYSEITCLSWNPMESSIFSSSGDDGRVIIWKIIDN